MISNRRGVNLLAKQEPINDNENELHVYNTMIKWLKPPECKTYPIDSIKKYITNWKQKSRHFINSSRGVSTINV